MRPPTRPVRAFAIGATLLATAAFVWILLESRSEPAPVRAEAREATVSRADRQTGNGPPARPEHARAPSPRDTGSPAPDQGSLDGTVSLSDSGPAAGATVLLESPRVRARVAADASGLFVSGPLPPGLYSVVALLGDLVSDRLDAIPLAPGEHVRGLRLTLSGGASLEGTVRDARSLAALPACDVRVPGAEQALAQCDHAGRFRLGPLPPGPMLVRVSSPGFAPRDATVDLARHSYSRADVLLTPGARLSGRVLGPASQPMAGVAVITSHYSMTGVYGAAEVRASTDRAGAFTLEGVAPGRVAVCAQAPGYAEARSREVELGQGEHRDGLVLRLGTGGAIAGRVQTASGQPVEGAQVQALRLSDAAPAGGDTTDATGGFRVDGLEGGEYSVAASAPPGRALAAAVRVGDREEAEVVLVLGGDVIRGRVVDSSARPVPGALVSAAPMDGGGQAARAAATDASGAFRVEGLQGRAYRVEARAAGRSAVEKRGVPPGADVELVLADDGAIEGFVWAPTGGSATDFTLAVVPAAGDAPGSVAGRYRVLRLVSPDGAFRVEPLPAGSYEVRAAAPGFSPASQAARVQAGATTTIDLRLGAGASLRGRVLDAKGAGVAGCRVHVAEEGPYFARAGDDERHAVSDAAGAFRLEGVAPGKVEVVAGCPGGEFAFGGAEVGASGGELTLRLHPGRRGEQDTEFGGVGAVLGGGAGGVFVRSVAEGGPAFLAGIGAGDEILSVDGWSVAGSALMDVIGRIRGPLGTSVALGLRRGPAGTLFTAVAERRRIVLP